MRSGRLAVSLSVTALLLGTAVLAAPSAGAREDGDSQRVRLIDDCDPATFNAAIGPGTCVKHGDTTFTDFLAQLGKNGNIANEAADDWEFKPGDFHVDAGATIDAVNVGGEFHTFTRVAKFGGGCVPVLNDILGLTPVPECDDLVPGTTTPVAFGTSGVPSGGMLKVDTTGLAPGTYKFQCLIHPWMESVVQVRAADHSGRG